MKKFLAVLLISTVMVAAPLDAMAKRFGGGMSMGRPVAPLFQNRATTTPKFGQATTQNRQAAAQNTARQQTQAPQKRSMLGGLLGGLAAGLGIAALLSMLGIHSAAFANILTMLLLFGVGFFLLRAFAANRLKQMQTQEQGGSASMSNTMSQQTPRYEEPAASTPASASMAQGYGASSARPGSLMDQLNGGVGSNAQSSWDSDLTPEGFDIEAFKKTAIENFKLYLQAYAGRDPMKVSEFFDDEVFIQFTHLLRQNKFEVSPIQINDVRCKYLGMAQNNDEYQTAFDFEADIVIDNEAETVKQMWVLAKPVNGDQGWLVVGVQAQD